MLLNSSRTNLICTLLDSVEFLLVLQLNVTFFKCIFNLLWVKIVKILRKVNNVLIDVRNVRKYQHAFNSSYFKWNSKIPPHVISWMSWNLKLDSSHSLHLLTLFTSPWQHKQWKLYFNFHRKSSSNDQTQKKCDMNKK